ncbi:MAG: ester cyclase [Acidobacteriales bacterium]|nr:ester cyclase [Terriglobales bacterium]
MAADAGILIQRWFEEVWNQKRIEAMEELSSPDAISHGHTAQPIGMAEFREFARSMQAAFPDIHFTLEKPVVEGDRAAAFWRAEMTHMGTFLGIPATGGKVSIHGIAMGREQGGKMVESWNSWDQMGLMQQIGAVSPPLMF